MAILVLDPNYEQLIRAWERDDRYDEVWEGSYGRVAAAE